jgi:dUTP pyrophosphatase
MLNIRIINKSANANPEYATIHAAGMDLRADISEKMELLPLDRCLVPTGIFIELPIGYEAQIRPRSGLAINSGITLLNSPGTIDADYRGEIKVIMINLSKQPFYINPRRQDRTNGSCKTRDSGLGKFYGTFVYRPRYRRIWSHRKVISGHFISA